MQMFKELKRRNVIRVGLAYAMVSWLVLQIADVAVPLLELPRWAGKLVFLLLAVGLPIVLIIAWAFEVTPTGIKLQSELDKTPIGTDTKPSQAGFCHHGCNGGCSDLLRN